MAFLNISNVRIAGISACVPKHIIESASYAKEHNTADISATTGIYFRRIGDIKTSDLCYAAAEKLILDLNWDKSEIGAIIFVTQNPDYILPATSCILQDRLGLSKETYASDTSLGCSGWVYGLSQIASLLSNGTIKKALLLAGDAKRHFDPSFEPLFGYAGTATALEFNELGGGEFVVSFWDRWIGLRFNNYSRWRN